MGPDQGVERQGLNEVLGDGFELGRIAPSSPLQSQSELRSVVYYRLRAEVVVLVVAALEAMGGVQLR